jgi:two-component sensor histidine kinase
VLSIAKQTFRGDDFKITRDAFSERVSALDNAHQFLNAADWRQASVPTVVNGVLGHMPNKAAIHVDGPEVQLGPKQALALALATNELATNAVKYGALKESNGRVDVTWRTTPDNFEWTWRESGGAPVEQPTRTGFGGRVIKNMLAEEMKGSSDVTYDSTGLVCRLTAPLDKLLSQ